MKIHKILMPALLSSLFALPSISTAHDIIDSLSGTVPSAADAPANIDVFHTQCFNWATNQDFDGDGVIDEYAGAATRLAFKVRKLCTTNNAACNAAAGTVRASAAAFAVTTGSASRDTTSATTGSGAIDPDSGIWGIGDSTWGSVPAGTNSEHVIVVSHDGANANGYHALIHCENSFSAVIGSSHHTGTGINSQDYIRVMNQ